MAKNVRKYRTLLELDEGQEHGIKERTDRYKSLNDLFDIIKFTSKYKAIKFI